MKVTALHIYPIKSLGGIEVKSCVADFEGFENDRQWMLVDREGNFMTQRNHAEMARFSCKLDPEGISVSYQGESLLIPLDTYDRRKKIRVKVWSSKLKAYEVSTEASKWFSERLRTNVMLVKKTDISKRSKRLYTPPFKTVVSFADGYPYLILGEASMKELNGKVDIEIPADRFRANIMVSTSEAHEEDSWNKDFKVGEVTMKVVKPCARCVVTTIDQQTGEAGKEPLKTLSTYRKWSNKIWFGANTICIEPGTVSVGDKVLII